MTALIEEAELLRRQQDLFELYVSDYIFLQRCMVGGGMHCGARHTPRFVSMDGAALCCIQLRYGGLTPSTCLPACLVAFLHLSLAGGAGLSQGIVGYDGRSAAHLPGLERDAVGQHQCGGSHGGVQAAD